MDRQNLLWEAEIVKNCCTELPEGYVESLSVDLQKDKKLALLINGLAAVIAVAVFVVGCFISPLGGFFAAADKSDKLDFIPLLIKLGVMVAGTIAYIILHEAVHGIVMKAYGAPKVRFGFTGLYAFAGSDCFFGKMPYIVIALAPIVVWGVVLAAICAAVPSDWFWPVYMIQLMNLSGAGGDLYVTAKFSRLPRDILVRDVGTAMVVYAKD